MAKYFDGEKKLPFLKTTVDLEHFSEERLLLEINKGKGAISLCLQFQGFPKDSLGYVFNIQQEGEDFRVMDITGKQLLTVRSPHELAAMILHASGAKYDAEWQSQFQKVRNQISSRAD